MEEALNVHEQAPAESVIKLLLKYFPNYKVNFDLIQCDKILRVEALGAIKADTVIPVVMSGVPVPSIEASCGCTRRKGSRTLRAPRLAMRFFRPPLISLLQGPISNSQNSIKTGL